MSDVSVQDLYANHWWPQAREILEFVKCYGDGDLQQPTDLMGFDCLDGGVDEVEFISDLLDCRPDDVLLDVGCGIGGPARHWHQKFGCGVLGIDPNPEQISSARYLSQQLSGFSDTIKFLKGTVHDLKGNHAVYTHAVALESLNHESDKLGALKILSDALVRNGVLVLADYFSETVGSACPEIFGDSFRPWYELELHKFAHDSGLAIQAIYDRSTQLAEAYSWLNTAFFYSRWHPSTLKKVLFFWNAQSLHGFKKLRRYYGALKFLVTRTQAVERFLQLGRENIRKFCATQARELQVGTMQYKVYVLRKKS